MCVWGGVSLSIVYGMPLGVCPTYLLPPYSGQVSCIYVLLFFHVLIFKFCNGMLVLSATLTLDCLDSISLVHSTIRSTLKEWRFQGIEDMEQNVKALLQLVYIV